MHGKVEEVIFTLSFVALSLFNSIFKMKESIYASVESFSNLVSLSKSYKYTGKKYVLSSFDVIVLFCFQICNSTHYVILVWIITKYFQIR